MASLVNDKRKRSPDQHDQELDTNTSKRRRRTKYWQKFLPKYNDIPGIKASRKGEAFAYCVYCRDDFKIANSGLYDIKRHRETASHVNLEKKAKGSQSISNLFSSQPEVSQISTQIIKAEAMMTDFIIDLNLPITAADRLNKILKKAFPDSKIAAGYECGRSKTTAMIKCLADFAKEDIIDAMKARPYSISTDGSNDQQNKQFPIVVTFPSVHGVTTCLLTVPVLTESGTGQISLN